MSVTRYCTLAAPFGFEPEPIKGSRFIARLAPVSTPAEAKEFLAHVAGEFDDARHICFAWRLGPEGKETRTHDADEPGNSAGRPILAQLEGHGVTDAIAIVVRYFGGTKLGVGGLIRAYGGAAGQALDRAPLAWKDVRDLVRCRHAYAASGAVAQVLATYAVVPEDAVYGADVAFSARVPRAQRKAFEAAFRDATHGQGELSA